MRMVGHIERTRLASIILVLGLLTAWFFVASLAHAQQYAYPVPWPKAAGGTIVAVPVGDARVSVYHRVSSPQGTGWDTPFTGAPETVIDPAPAGEPIILRAPAGTAPADQDDFFVLLSTSQLVISAGDDERYNPGSPDRLFFFPATSGTFRGRELYGHCNAGWFANRVRVFNPGSSTLTATFSAWTGTAWTSVGTLDVAADSVGVFDPPATYPNAAYRVTTTSDALVIEGYMADNASLPAVDVATGVSVGDDLWGYGQAYDIRAVSALDYTIDAQPEAGGAWTRVASGTLAANERVTGLLPGAPTTFSRTPSEVTTGSYVRIRTTGGRAWAIVGTRETAWNGYYFPAQSEASCVFGSQFLTTGLARTLVVLPNASTTVRIFDETTGAMLDSYTSSGAWELHHFHSGVSQRVELEGGPGAVMMIGLGTGTMCTVSGPGTGNCGILEGGYSVPPLGFQCAGSATTLGACTFAPTACSGPPPTMTDGGVMGDTDGGAVTGTDGGAMGDTDGGAMGDTDGGAMATLDAGTSGSDAALPPSDGASTRPDGGTGGGGTGGEGGCNCGALGRGPTRPGTHGIPLLLGAFGVAAARRRRRRR
jgi:hypothetical protein